MHIILTPVGSAGDVLPFIGLGAVLRDRGHEVDVLTAAPFREAAERAELGFIESQSTEDFESVIADPDMFDLRRGVRTVMRSIAKRMRDAYDRLAGCYRPGRSVVIGHPLAFPARVFEETHRAPAATVHLAPASLRSVHLVPAHEPGRTMTGLPTWAKRGAWWLIDRFMIDPLIVPALNQWRRELGLAPIRRIFKEWVNSPDRVIALFPEWFGPRQPDWPPQLRLTGFPLYDDSNAPIAADVEAFLAAGPPPLVFTAGTAHAHARGFFDAALDATRRLGARAVFVSRFRDPLPPDLPAEVHHASYVPFSKLLPRCRALIHHGGIGTCSHGLAVGIPQVAVPHAFDQPDNALRLERLGVGQWIDARCITGDALAGKLTALVDSPSVSEACRRWRDALAEEDGLARAATLVEELDRRLLR